MIGEADGLEKYDAGWQRVRDEKRRQERFEQPGLIVVRWGAEDLAGFELVAIRLRDAFARGARRLGDDRRWTVRPAVLPHAS